MSDKWETVGKNNKSGSPSVKKNGKKPKPMPKLEDILPQGSLMAMYPDVDPESAAKEKEANKDNNNKGGGGGKVEVVAKKKKESAPPPPPKPKVPKNITEAVKMNLRVDDLRQLIEACQTKFPDSPLLWLRDLASYLNLKLVNEGSSDFELFGGEPLSALSPNMKKSIVGLIQNVGDNMCEVYAETCLANIGHEMAKNLSVLGWIVISQVLAELKPQVLMSNVNRLIELRNSYQNRPTICIAILKALGEAGKYDLKLGMKIWLDIMLPLITMKHFTKFVVDYATKLLDHHGIDERSKIEKPVMDIPNFLTLQDIVFVVASQGNKEYCRQLQQEYPRIRHLALAGFDNHELFPSVMAKFKAQNMPNQMCDSLDIMSRCLINNPASLVHWQKLYISQLAESGSLLQYINSNWSQLQNIDSPLFRDTIQAFQDYNLSVSHKEEATLCLDACSDILDRLARKNTTGFYWKTWSLVLLLGIGAVVTCDVQANQTFHKSHIAAFLRDAGQYDRVCAICDQVVSTCDQVQAWGHKNLPVYYETTARIAGPYAAKAIEVTKDVSEVVLAQASVLWDLLKVYVEQGRVYVEEQLPWLQESAGQAAQQAKTMTLNAYTTVSVKVNELLGQVDWVQVKEQLVVTLEQAKVVTMQYVDKLQQQINQLVK